MKKSGQSKKTRNKKSTLLYMFVIIISFAISTGISYFYFKEMFAFESSFIADIESRHVKTEHREQEKGSLRLYESDKQFPITSGKFSRKDELLVATEDIIKKQVKSYGARLLDLYMDKEGVIYIDLGGEIKKNFKGDAFEELSIIAGLYKGIKAIIPGFTALKILIDGRDAESFGGHIDISKPIGEEIAENI